MIVSTTIIDLDARKRYQTSDPRPSRSAARKIGSPQDRQPARSAARKIGSLQDQ
jgi:hypothetical protein